MPSVLLLFFTFTLASLPMMLSVSVNVFILGGATNMVGVGGVGNGAIHGDDEWDEAIPSQCQSNAFILRLNAANKWEEAREPLHSFNGSILSFGIGPGLAFATRLLEMEPAIGLIGLIPCAVKGSYISSWSRNGSHYSDMLARTRAALAQGGVLRAFLWYQGESDSRDGDNAEAYGPRLLELFNDIRRDLESPSLPIIHVALASGFGYKETIRRAQFQLELTNVKCVDADGLQLEPPSCSHRFVEEKCLHLSTPAQIQLGTMLAHAFLEG